MSALWVDCFLKCQGVKRETHPHWDGNVACTSLFSALLNEWLLPYTCRLMVTTENFAVFSLLGTMGTRKKVHAFVRVKPTDDFAHEMIRYGGDNRVSAMCLPSTAQASLSQRVAWQPCSKSFVGAKTELVKFRWTLESVGLNRSLAMLLDEEIHQTPVFNCRFGE